ncbi:MAG: iron-sulfur cluster carrier protein ApbC [Oceanicoccus sp.]
MSAVTEVDVKNALKDYLIPRLSIDIPISDVVQSVLLEGGRASVAIVLGFPAASIVSQIRDDIVKLITSVPGIDSVIVDISCAVLSAKSQRDMRSMENVKNIVAVASGKGGVGKSTTAVNLALALLSEGAKVGLLDADIYGPSQQMMLGVDASQRPEQEGQQYLLPIEAHGLKTMSMGYLVTDKTPMVWRGPMAGGALTQLLTQTWWGDLDYLIIDMPPGTGDIQLTLSQKVVLAGAVIVTTPQDIALLDAQKGIEMFNKVEVPVLGVVENMAIHVCSECGHQEHIFGAGGGDRIASEYHVPLLGSLPLSLAIRQDVDVGLPTVVKEPDSVEATLYGGIARTMAAQLAQQTGVTVMPNITMQDD